MLEDCSNHGGINMSKKESTRMNINSKELIKNAFKKLNPATLFRNPVMFIVEIGSILTTIITIMDFISKSAERNFDLQISIWLWFTILFANFAESLAEGRGKAQADALRKTRKDIKAKKLIGDKTEVVLGSTLKKGDIVLVEAGDIIPGDGEVIEGVASVDESAITGESAPVIRESGGDRSSVTAGTKVLSDWIKVKISSDPGESFLDKMISLVEGAKRQKTPNEIALTIMLIGLTIILLLATVTIEPYAIYSGTKISIPTLIALLVCLIPTTIGGLLSAIGIAGMDRLIKKNILAMSGRAVEAAGDVDVLLLDKTGTITFGNRMATEFIPAPGVTENELAMAAQMSSLSDETPEGRSIVVLAKDKYGIREHNLKELNVEFIPFTAKTRMSGININNNKEIRKGAIDAIENYVKEKGGNMPEEVLSAVKMIAQNGGTPLVVAENERVLGVIHLKDIVKGGIKERFADLRRMGIKTVMITGDNPMTAKAIADEAGVDEFVAEAKPETKLSLIKEYQANGHLVAMTGDGTNDAPALAQADVGVAMNSGTQAAKEAGNMVDLDSSPTKLIAVVEIGKQLLMTRGALTTFSIANDVAKYFAIIPAMFSATYPQLGVLNIMHLKTPESAVLSAIIFNALIIIALIPLALKGVKYRPLGAAAIFKRNMLIYGLGGLIVPFVGIKIIDMIITFLGLVH